MNIRDRMAHGAAWMVSFKLIDRGFGFVSTMVLARLLVPADFGIVAMATSLIGLLELLTYFGLDMALLRQRETTEDHFNAVWSLNVLCGCAAAVLMIALAVPAAHFYQRAARNRRDLHARRRTPHPVVRKRRARELP